MEVSSSSMNVASVTVSATTHGLMTGRRIAAGTAGEAGTVAAAVAIRTPEKNIETEWSLFYQMK
jgi:hypothetical protein